MEKRRVVVTGIGTINACGLNVEAFWDSLKNGRSGISRVTNVDLKDSPSLIGGEVKNEVFNPEDFIDRKLARRMDRFSHFGWVAAEEAVKSSGLENASVDKDRVGVLIAAGIGGIQTFYENSIKMEKEGHKRVSPLMIPMIITDITSGYVSIRYGYRGPNYSVSSACASGAHAIAMAYNHILVDDADVMIVGGTEAAITPLGYAGFTQAQALSTHYNDEPTKGSRPFDKDRDGFVMGEGAGVLVLEELNHALKRGAPIYAEMVGYGMSADAHHITAPCPDGAGAALAMKVALRKCGLKPTDIQLVNTHGTSTPLGDVAETMAIKQVFGDYAYKLKINSTKSMTGHTLGAAGGIEAVAVVKMLQEGIIHPTINLDNPDEQCDLDYVPHKAIKMDVKYAISNSFGFGGHDVSLVFKKYE
ncbi:3-oxoacyl-[acyl-carrier-protein] synthase, KASII [Brevinematales bacterium NS]|nr:3-oxoacyl-[acyl-carrier-protein] synthase, KASII [Brevinematales bacterium NS]